MSSPKSEKSQIRFPTPVPDPDNHRSQSLLSAGNAGGSSRRSTACSGSGLRPDMLHVDDARERQPISRDFEQAIIDDDKNRNEDSLGVERSGASPTVRHALSRRAHHTLENISRSRDSSSERSTSPPNSIDAFAESRRRERANTLGSKAPSELDLPLHRTVSGGTHGRRPTIGNGSIIQSEIPVDGDRPEEDVCFPQADESSELIKIDFEELEEFAAERKRGRPYLMNERERHSFNSHTKGTRVFNAYQGAHGGIPHIVEPPQTPQTSSGREHLETESIVDEKLGGAQVKASSVEPRLIASEANRFSFLSSELDQSIHAQELGDLVLPGESFRDLFRLPEEGGAWWLDVMNPSEEELEVFQKAFGIHRLTSEDIERQEIREKVELFSQYYFVCFRSFYQMDKFSEDYLEPVNVYMVVFREGLISFTYTPNPHAADVRKRIGKLRNHINLTADWICYAMIDNIVDCFGPVIHSIELETDQIEDQVFVARADDFSSLIRQIGACRKKVMSLMRLLGGKADVIRGFAKRCNEQYSVTPRGEIGLYLGDIQDHVVTMMSNLGHFEKMLGRCHSNYLAQLSVDNISQGNHANKVLSKITFIATILVPLNLICGLFGMNVPVPGRESEGFGWFFGILGVILAFVVGTMIMARRLKFV